MAAVRAAGFPCRVTSRLAFGLAAVCWGAKDTAEAPDHFLLLRDFTTAKGDPLEDG